MSECKHEYMDDGRCAVCEESTEDILRAENKRLREALSDAALSLETIAAKRGFEGHDDFVATVRPYAASRAAVVREALIDE